MCLKSIGNFISSITNIKQTQQQDDSNTNVKCCKEPPKKPCYETDNNIQSIQYEYTRIAISSKQQYSV